MDQDIRFLLILDANSEGHQAHISALDLCLPRVHVLVHDCAAAELLIERILMDKRIISKGDGESRKYYTAFKESHFTYHSFVGDGFTASVNDLYDLDVHWQVLVMSSSSIVDLELFRGRFLNTVIFGSDTSRLSEMLEDVVEGNIGYLPLSVIRNIPFTNQHWYRAHYQIGRLVCEKSENFLLSDKVVKGIPQSYQLIVQKKRRQGIYDILGKTKDVVPSDEDVKMAKEYSKGFPDMQASVAAVQAQALALRREFPVVDPIAEYVRQNEKHRESIPVGFCPGKACLDYLILLIQLPDDLEDNIGPRTLKFLSGHENMDERLAEYCQ